MQNGLILFAHGSRDPLWRLPLESLATAIAHDLPQTSVRCAYLELCEPDLEHVVSEMVAQGAQQLTVLPMFFGVGKHAREDFDLPPHSRTKLMAVGPQILENCGYEDHTIYR